VRAREAEPARSLHRTAWPPRRRTGPRFWPLAAALSAVAAGVIVAGVGVVLAHQPHDARLDAPALIATPDHYLGVAEANEIASYRPVSEFAATIGRQPNMVLYYTALGTPFYVRLAREASEHGAVTFVQMNPGRTSLSVVAAGRDDGYLRSFADSVRSFGGPVVIGFAPEMNASWDSWGWHHTKPAVWIAAWRHVVTLFRQQHARNVTWLWTINADVPGATGPIQRWWPGSAFVDWVGIDGYYYYSSSTFATVFSPTINAVRALTSKPVLISETAIGQVAGQAAKMADLFAGIRASRVVGFVWFDETQHAGVYHQDWRLEGHSAAIAAFRQALSTYYDPGQ
jgi:hypothetical protein